MAEIRYFELPDLYRNLTGRTKKKFAWEYLKTNFPELDPLSEQPYLEDHHKLLVVFNYEKARRITQEINERREAKKKEKKKK